MKRVVSAAIAAKPNDREIPDDVAAAIEAAMCAEQAFEHAEFRRGRPDIFPRDPNGFWRS